MNLTKTKELFAMLKELGIETPSCDTLDDLYEWAKRELLRRQLADLAHRQWSGWMEYLFEKCQANEDGTVTIPAWAVERWRRQMQTHYGDLPEDEKISDLAEADRVLAVFDGR